MTQFTHTLSRGLIGVLLLGACSATGADNAGSPELKSLRVGINGWYKVGRWTAVRARFQGGPAGETRLWVNTLDPDGHHTRSPGPAQSLFTDSEFDLQMKSGRLDAPLTLELTDTGEAPQRLWTQTINPGDDLPDHILCHPPLRQSTMLVAVLGPATGFDRLQELTAADATGESKAARPVQVVPVRSPDELPRTVWGFDSLDVLVITDHYDLPAEVNSALQQWVERGGHLLVTCGQDVTAWQNSPLAHWVPVGVQGQIALRRLEGLEAFPGRSARIELKGAQTIPSAQLSIDEGEMLVTRLRDPLLCRVPCGFGKVTFSGVDFHREPISQWADLPALCNKLLHPQQEKSGQQRQTAQLTQSGISDLMTQLYTAQEDHPEVRRWPTWAVMGFMLGYLLLIGPLDYLLVQHLLKRPGATWITLPCWILLGASIAVWQAGSTNARELEVNQVEILDLDSSRGQSRCYSWVNLYSPETVRYPIQMTPGEFSWLNSGGGQPRLSWVGVPEASFGGMYRPAGIEFGKTQYSFSDESSRIDNLPVQVWSTRNVAAEWSAALDPVVQSRLESNSVGHLSGTITHQLPVPIEDWLVVYRNRLYYPDARVEGAEKIAPGQVWEPGGRGVSPRSVRDFLTGEYQVRGRKQHSGKFEADLRSAQRAYDPLDHDLTAIVRMMTLHEAAGGSAYTGLENYSLPRIELSDLLSLNRAILIGRINLPLTRVELAGQSVEPTRQATFVRILMPVTDRNTQRELFDLDKNK